MFKFWYGIEMVESALSVAGQKTLNSTILFLYPRAAVILQEIFSYYASTAIEAKAQRLGDNFSINQLFLKEIHMSYSDSADDNLWISPKYRAEDWRQLDLTHSDSVDWFRAVDILYDRINGR